MTESGSRVIDVAVGVIEDPSGRVLLARRPPGRPYEGYWEFPGGKVEPGEAVATALARELHEELGLSGVESTPWLIVTHDYPHARVRLFFRRVRQWQGEPQAREGQALAWRLPSALELSPLLPASLAPIRWLGLPDIYRLSCASLMGVQTFETAVQRALEAQADQGGAGSPLWLQLREPDLPPADVHRLFQRLMGWRRRLPLRLIVSSRHDEALWRAADGVHFTSRDLLASLQRPDVDWVGVSCHSEAELEAAARLGADFAVFGPVAPTDSHPGAAGIGFQALEAQIALARLPVFALGGMTPDLLPAARGAGAQGVALMRAAWR